MFAIWRSNRYWAGLSNDLIIEQTLMRTMKARGGLAHGRGVLDEQQRNIWLLSMPACASYNEAKQELTHVRYSFSKQHKELGDARIKRDVKDNEMT